VKRYNLAIVGATGAVGKEILKVLAERNFPYGEIKMLASERSEGKKITFQDREYTVQKTGADSFKNTDIAFFAGGSASKLYAHDAVKAGAIAVDNSSSFRYDPEVPLIVPEVNPEDVSWHKGIIANPNCSTIQMVVALKPLHDAAKIKRIVASTYQAVSGAGRDGIDELKNQVAQISRQEFAQGVRGAADKVAEGGTIVFNSIKKQAAKLAETTAGSALKEQLNKIAESETMGEVRHHVAKIGQMDVVEDVKEQFSKFGQPAILKPQVFQYQIAFNVIPHIDAFQDNGYTKEEMKMVWETQKMFHDDDLKISVTTVRVPVFRSHSESINIELEKSLSVDEAREILRNAPGVVVIDNVAENEYPMPLFASDTDQVYVGRIREDISTDNGLSLWVVADQIRKGAATNAVQIAELLVKDGLV
jgi:aspartate-semialdehyde dehydrogenase